MFLIYQKLNIYSNIVTEKFITLFAYDAYLNGDTNCDTIKDIISMCLIAQVLINLGLVCSVSKVKKFQRTQ